MQNNEMYRDSLKYLTDDDLVSAAENMVWLSAYAANNPHSKYHVQVDIISRECDNRGKPWLYQQGWNQAYESCGYEVSEVNKRMATPEGHNFIE